VKDKNFLFVLVLLDIRCGGCDKGFEPVTSTDQFFYILDKLWSQFGHSCMIKRLKYKVSEKVPGLTPASVLPKHLTGAFYF